MVEPEARNAAAAALQESNQIHVGERAVAVEPFTEESPDFRGEDAS